MDSSALLERVRAVALALPSATERVSHGSPSWFIGRAPMFATFDDHHHGADHVAVWAAAAEGVQGALVASDGAAYFVPPYVGGRGWVGLRLHAGTDWGAVEDLLADGWRLLAPARLRDG